MIAHLSICAREIARARNFYDFYDAALKPLGYTCLSADEGSIGYGAEAAEFWVYGTEHPVPPDDRSGLHFCFAAPDRASVDAFHKAALKAGGKDNGEPGLRADYGPNYYAAFAVDPDGYRIEAWCGKKA
jgi:catechol 2,3-dioxygenase-like lactoylglutathione lyase family enzyme